MVSWLDRWKHIHMMTSWNGNIFRATGHLCGGIHRSPVNSPAKRPVTRSFGLFFELRLNKRLSKQSWDCWFETPSHPLRRHNDTQQYFMLHGRCIIHFVVCDFALMLTCHIDCSYCWADWLTSTNSADCHLFQQYTVMHSETDMW